MVGESVRAEKILSRNYSAKNFVLHLGHSILDPNSSVGISNFWLYVFRVRSNCRYIGVVSASITKYIKKQKLFYKFDNIKKNNIKYYDLIFIDTTSEYYKILLINNYFKLLTPNKGVIIFSYYNIKDISKYIDTNYIYDIIYFNTQTFIVYKQKETKIQNKHTYSILSRYIPIEIFDLFFKKRGNWIKVDNYYDKIDFLYVDKDIINIKEIYNIKTTIKSIINKKKTIIDEKDLLYNYIKKNNITIFNKYLIEYYNINKKKLNQYKKLFNNKKLWIIKLIPGGKSYGIRIVKTFENFKNYIKQKFFDKHKTKRWIIQKYIEDPLLYNGYKFHIRIFFQVTYINNELKCYYSKKFNTGGIFLSDLRYTTENLSSNIHDTHAFGNKEELYFYPDFKRMYGKEKYIIVKNKIIDFLKYLKTIINISCYKESLNCFYTYGLYVMITKKLDVKILEINPTIGMGGYDNIIESYIGNLLEITIDKIIKPVKNINKLNGFIEL